MPIMSEGRKPLEMAAIGILALLTIIALILILTDLQGWR